MHHQELRNEDDFFLILFYTFWTKPSSNGFLSDDAYL